MIGHSYLLTTHWAAYRLPCANPGRLSRARHGREDDARRAIEMLLWALTRRSSRTFRCVTSPAGRTTIARLATEEAPGAVPRTNSIRTLEVILCDEISRGREDDAREGQRITPAVVVPGYHRKSQWRRDGWRICSLRACRPRATFSRFTRILSLLGTMNWQPSGSGPAGYVRNGRRQDFRSNIINPTRPGAGLWRCRGGINESNVFPGRCQSSVITGRKIDIAIILPARHRSTIQAPDGRRQLHQDQDRHHGQTTTKGRRFQPTCPSASIAPGPQQTSCTDEDEDEGVGARQWVR